MNLTLPDTSGGRSRESWVPAIDSLRSLDSDYAAVAEAFAGLPWRSDRLDDKTRALVCLAANATTTQLYAPATRTYIRLALSVGATAAEVLEVLQLASTIGIHACTLGVPLLVEEVDPAGDLRRVGLDGDPRRAALKADFVAARGYWNDVWDGLLWLDPDYFRAFTDFSSAPWRNGPLAPKVKEFIYIAVDTTTTHLFELGTRIHIRNALKLGATGEEIMDVLQLVSAVGLNACALGVPILREELEAIASEGKD